jgi:hypothetical protein
MACMLIYWMVICMQYTRRRDSHRIFQECSKFIKSLAICSESPASLMSMSHCTLERQKSKEGTSPECHSSFLRFVVVTCVQTAPHLPGVSSVFLSPEISTFSRTTLSIHHNTPNSIPNLITVNMSGAIPTSTSVTESAVINGVSSCWISVAKMPWLTRD